MVGGAPCSGHGVCKGGACKCAPGWGGEGCDRFEYSKSACSEFNDCSDRGLCLPTGKCDCVAGWAGQFCQLLAECPNNCREQGICVHGRCECAPGFTGPDCGEVHTSPGERTQCPDDCSGHGVCLPAGEGTFACTCATGWTGVNCFQQSHCPRECSHHGICEEGKCVCNAMYSGDDCSIATRGDPDGPQCINDCSGRGVCRDGLCVCPPGYDEADCSQVRMCEADCSGHGVCTHGVCQCSKLFSGTDCSTPVAKPEESNSETLRCPRDCFARGSCIDDDAGGKKCSCNPGYTGRDCAEVESDPCGADLKCGGNGRCQHGQCYCDLGWSGDRCETRAESVNGCSGHGLFKWGKCWCDMYFKTPADGVEGEECSEQDGEIPGSNAGLGTNASIGVCVGAAVLGVLSGIIWKLLYDARRRRQLRAFLETAEQDSFGKGFGKVTHIGDRR
jgi:syndecan 4